MGCMGTLGGWESSQEVDQADRLNESESSYVKHLEGEIYSISMYCSCPNLQKKILHLPTTIDIEIGSSSLL